MFFDVVFFDFVIILVDVLWEIKDYVVVVDIYFDYFLVLESVIKCFCKGYYFVVVMWFIIIFFLFLLVFIIDIGFVEVLFSIIEFFVDCKG